jgi:hypothetical protein
MAGVPAASGRGSGMVGSGVSEDSPMAKKKATIFFGDEAGVRSVHRSGTTWTIQGKTPVVSSTGARFALNLISAVSAQGELRFMTIHIWVGARVFIEFLKRLLHNAERMIFLIVDGHPAHKAKSVAMFLESMNDHLQLFVLPSHSQELNPDKRAWNDLKNNGIGQKCIDSLKQTSQGRDWTLAIGSKNTSPLAFLLPKSDHKACSLMSILL